MRIDGKFVLVTLPLLLLALGALGCSSPELAEEQTPIDVGGGPEHEAPPPRFIIQATEQPRGLVSKSDGATPGYVLFSQFSSALTYLIDSDGHVVHTWKNGRAPGTEYLQDDGSIIRVARMDEPPNFKTGGVSGYLQKISWDGELVWEWHMGDEERMLHHDIEVMPNGNILAIAWERKTADEARAAGRHADNIPEQGLWTEWILEVEPVPPNDARIVWEWHVWDHLVQNLNPDGPSYGEPSEHPRRFDLNAGAGENVVDDEELEQLKALGYVPDDATQEDLASDFLHMNSIEYHPGLDQIVVGLYEMSEIWIIDHSTSTEEAKGTSGGRAGHGGDFLYRWGNPQIYGRGDASDQMLFNQHQALWIPDGWPGAGNLTVFSNGTTREEPAYSEVVEWTPPLETNGGYPIADGEPFGPTDVVWRYFARDDPESFFSPFVSGAQRLANGNTFICSGAQGRFFEVTSDGDIVWEYRSPFHGELEAWMPPGTEMFPYAAFRATKIPPDHPALAGRELAPLDPQPTTWEPPPPPTGEPTQD